MADLLILPVEDIPAHHVPGHAIGKADGLCCRKEHLRDKQFGGLVVVPADLVHSEGDSLILVCVLALDHKHRNAVDEKNHVLAVAVNAVVDIELFRDLKDVIVDGIIVHKLKIQLAVLLGAEKLALITQKS